MYSRFRFCSASFVALIVLSGVANAQQRRITRRIDTAERIALSGNVSPRANPAFDRGRVAPSLKLSYVTLTLAMSASQKADLTSLLAQQRDPASANYHQWLTPAQYADRFGVSTSDLSTITQWLQSQGLAIVNVAQGRNWVAVSGSAAQMENAFSTEIHQYVTGAETHFANATNPSIPAALSGMVLSIRGLNDFRMKPALVTAKYTSAHGNHYIAPNDLATLYDIQPAYNAGINGSGQKLVVAGQSQVPLSDIQQFQSAFNIPANLPQVLLVPNTQDPGISSGDREESDLDLEWSGAVARSAAISFVYSENVMDAVNYAIDQNLAPVITVSYGSCEPDNGQADTLTFQSWAQRGNAQGITWFNASGDDGAADCSDDTYVSPQAQASLAVDTPASVPEITGVGGTEFVEGAGQFWNATNDANGASVLSYIPETAWNDSAEDGSPSSSGGGASIFFSKPSWQTGPGVPGDNARHVPDVALSASADHDAYIVYTDGSTTPQAYGGTSVPTPIFAGIAALLNQYQVLNGKAAGLGNINPQLYALAQSAPAIFHDITTGNNIVTAQVSCQRRQTCVTPTPIGYNAGVGYDPVTGLGSVDAWGLITGWNGGTPVIVNPPPQTPANVSLSLLSNLSSLGLQDIAFLTATATANDGVTTPTGVVQFSAGTTALGAATLVGSAGVATATITITGTQLPSGTTAIAATYNGSSSSAPVTSTVNVSVRAVGSSSNGTPVVLGLSDGASFQKIYSPGMILSVFGATLSPSTETAASVPLPVTMAGVAVTVNGVEAPLYYVSPGQLNIQVPWQTAVGSAATLTIDNNGQVASSAFFVGPASPGIFTANNLIVTTNIPATSGLATRGQTTTLYMAGAGAVTPAIATGSAPVTSTPLTSLPAPINTTLTVNGVPATTSFIGIPYGLAGVIQINFQVPTNIPTGLQPVIVNVNGVSSTPAYLNITN